MLKNKEWRDAVAMRAFYTSQTQKYGLEIILLCPNMSWYHGSHKEFQVEKWMSAVEYWFAIFKYHK